MIFSVVVISGLVPQPQLRARAMQPTSAAVQRTSATMDFSSTGRKVNVDEECIVQAENLLEQQACFDTDSTESTAVRTGFSEAHKPLSNEARRAKLMGGAESLQECLSTAESSGEIVECELDFNELVAGPVSEVDEACVVDAESELELQACFDNEPAVKVPAKPFTPGVPVSAEKRRSNLLGASESLQECLSSAESSAEVEECQLDYEELVSGGGVANAGTDLRITLPIAIVAVGLNVLLQHNAALTPGVM